MYVAENRISRRVILISILVAGMEKVIFIAGNHADLSAKPLFFLDTASVSYRCFFCLHAEVL